MLLEWTQFANPLVSAASGLIGVAVGAWMTGRHQVSERRYRYLLQQLTEFYSPMLGMREQIRIKSEIRLKISNAAGTAWPELVADAREAGLDAVQELQEKRWPGFERIIEYENRQLEQEILPLYRQMLQFFTAKSHLAEASTRSHHQQLIEFVDIWDRWLGGALPPEVLKRLEHGEERLQPFYEDLTANFERLQGRLRHG
jgi:hypothetical protein